MSDNARTALYGASYSARLASRAGTGDPQLSRVVGKHCESGDIVVDHEYLPGDVTPGTCSRCPRRARTASREQLQPRPAAADRGGAPGPLAVIVRGETVHDLLARDAGIDGAHAPREHDDPPQKEHP